MIARLLLALAGILLVFAPPAGADTWPAKPVTLIVPFPPGGGTDTFARPLAAQLSKQLGKNVIVDNRAGACGTIGASAAAKAAPDGYTFFIGAAHHAIAPSIYAKLDYKIEVDFIPITLIAHPPQVVVVNPNRIAAADLAALIDMAKKNPGKLSYASAGNGTTHHLAGELFKQLTQTDIVHVPYKGAGPALQDMLGAQVDMMFDGLGSSASHLRSGKLKALAVAAPKRAQAFPNVPTAAEAGLRGYEVSTWYAIWAVKGTPKEIVDRMYQEVTKALQTPELREIWINNGTDVPAMTPAEFGAYLKQEIARWGAVVKAGNIKVD